MALDQSESRIFTWGIIIDANTSVNTLIDANTSVNTLIDAKTSVNTLIDAKISVNTLIDANSSVNTLIDANSSVNTSIYANASVNPGNATLQGVAIPLNQITFVAIYLALTAFALWVGCRLFLWYAEKYYVILK